MGTICLVLALLLFGLAATGLVKSDRLDLVAAGLFFLVLSMLLPLI